MSSIIAKIPTLSIQDINNLRANARQYLDQPGRYEHASQVLEAIDKELARRYLPGMIKTFLAKNPDGFYGEVHRETERNYKLAASATCQQMFEKREFKRLLDNSDYADLIAMVGKAINLTNFIQGSFEKPKMLDAIRKNPHLYFSALYEMLWGKGDFPTKLGRFIEKMDELGLNKWTYVTYFPFLMDPDNNMFVKPEMIKKSLEISQYPLEYESTPTVQLYLEIMTFSNWLKDKLEALKPRDMIDIHSFMWHMAPTGKWSDD